MHLLDSPSRPLRARKPDLVVLDVVHEWANGLEDAPELRALTKARQVSVFRISLDADDLLGGIPRRP